jgi:hypothetical protein
VCRITAHPAKRDWWGRASDNDTKSAQTSFRSLPAVAKRLDHRCHECCILALDPSTLLDEISTNAVVSDQFRFAGVTRPFGPPFGPGHYALKAIVGRLIRSASATLRAAAL